MILKRYHIYNDYTINDEEEAVDGPWVMYTDVASMEARLTKLERVLAQLRVWSDREECSCHELLDELEDTYG